MRLLNTKSESLKAAVVRYGLKEKIVGQEKAIDALVEMTEKFHANLYDPTKPISSVLLLGPTGSGKTRIVEAFCGILHGDEKQMLKIDCGEFQHSHEIAKLIGSPPGYLGHRETPPLLTQERINNLKGKEYNLSILLFDEIEKASDTLWHILLGILDKGTITTGTNEKVDLTRTVILMTSNAGSGEMEFAINGGVGFKANGKEVDDKEVAEIGIAAAKRKFTSEFINRLDKIISCNALTKEQIKQIINLELDRLQTRLSMYCSPALHFTVSNKVKDAILEEGYDPKYNARNIKRVIDQRIQLPLARIIASNQCKEEESVFISEKSGEFIFSATIKKEETGGNDRNSSS